MKVTLSSVVAFVLLVPSLALAAQAKVYTGWPFDADEATRRQAETAQALGVPVRQEFPLDRGVALTMVLIPAGEFLMGSSMKAEEVDKRWPGGRVGHYADEHPRHRVVLTKPFYLGTCEARRGQFALFVAETGYKTDAERAGEAFGYKNGRAGIWDGVSWKNPGFPQTDWHPVVCVSWNDAVAFCAWLSKKWQATVTLPTEAQWEYACRAGSPATWPWGDREEDASGRANVADESDTIAWSYKFKGVRDGYAYTASVASFSPNRFGLQDMIGNVFEWCLDWHDKNYYYQEAPITDPPGAKEGLARVLRGGAWVSDPRPARSSYRFRDDPSSSAPFFGFRVLRTIQ